MRCKHLHSLVTSATNQSTELEQGEVIFNSYCLLSRYPELLHKRFLLPPHPSNQQSNVTLVGSMLINI